MVWQQCIASPVGEKKQSSCILIDVENGTKLKSLEEKHCFRKSAYHFDSPIISTTALANEKAALPDTCPNLSEFLQVSETSAQFIEAFSEISVKPSINLIDLEEHLEPQAHLDPSECPSPISLSPQNLNINGLCNNLSLSCDTERNSRSSNSCYGSCSNIRTLSKASNRSNDVYVADSTDVSQFRYSQQYLLCYRHCGQRCREDVTPLRLVARNRDLSDDGGIYPPNPKTSARPCPSLRSSATKSFDGDIEHWRLEESPHSSRNDFAPLLRRTLFNFHRQQSASDPPTEACDKHDYTSQYRNKDSVADGSRISKSCSINNLSLKSLSLDHLGSFERSTQHSVLFSSRGTYTMPNMGTHADDSLSLERLGASENYPFADSQVEAKLHKAENLFPRHVAGFSPSNLGISQNDTLVRRRMLPFAHPNFFQFLKTLPQNEFIHLARSVSRYRRTSRLDFTPSTIVSINLCSCFTPHISPVTSINSQNDFWSHQLPRGSLLHGVLDTWLSVMLVELHPELEMIEFLDRRLPAIIRQQVGNRLDRNFVVQISGISFLRCHLAGIWRIGDLPECTVADMRRLCIHPLYHHMLHDISNRQQVPIFRNLNLCPIQYLNCRSQPRSNHQQSSFTETASPTSSTSSSATSFLVLSPSTACSSSEVIQSCPTSSTIDTSSSSS